MTHVEVGEDGLVGPAPLVGVVVNRKLQGLEVGDEFEHHLEDVEGEETDGDVGLEEGQQLIPQGLLF